MSVVAVIGAGCSGTLVAVQLLRRHARRGTRVVLYERGRAFGPGLAYGTDRAEHLLNVPAGNMSAFPDRPEHFLEWAQLRHPGAASDSFLPRRLYGAYLSSLLDEAACAGEARGVSLTRCARGVARLTRFAGGPIGIVTEAGEPEHADVVVLALGNLPAVALPGCSHRFSTPWEDGALDIDRDHPVLLLGTGLTMLDASASLDAAGHRAPVYALSRRGLLTRPHRAGLGRAPVIPRLRQASEWPDTTAGLLRAVRDEAARATARGDDWRSVVASLRADTPRIWASLSLRERRRFLEHLRPWWDAHRHRSAPETTRIASAMQESGRLAVIAGRVQRIQAEARGGRLRVDLRLRGGNRRSLSVARILDCTATQADLRRSNDPFLQRIVSDGFARLDELGIGLDTRDHGALVGDDGSLRPNAFAIGPLRRGTLWESTAVPEIRVQAERLALWIGAGVGDREERRAAIG